jgi:hypothetical protein
MQTFSENRASLDECLKTISENRFWKSAERKKDQTGWASNRKAHKDTDKDEKRFPLDTRIQKGAQTQWIFFFSRQCYTWKITSSELI